MIGTGGRDAAVRHGARAPALRNTGFGMRLDAVGAAGCGMAWRGRHGRIVALSLLALGGWWLASSSVQPAHAGEARASFQVGIRIGPTSVVGNAVSASARTVSVATSAAAGNAARSVTASSAPGSANDAALPATLPRVGGGWCVRASLPDGRWRWHCE